MKATKFTIGRKLFLLSLIPIAVMIAAALVVSLMLFDRKIRQDARKVTKQAADNTAAAFSADYGEFIAGYREKALAIYGEGGLNVLSFLKHTDRSVSGSRDAGGTAED